MNEKNFIRRRNKTLLIVEGKKEEELFRRLFFFFPELSVFPADIIVYRSNIYDLERIIREEYGTEWDKDEIDLPFLIGRKTGTKLHLQDFTNIFLIFDFDPQDTFYSSDRIRRLQKHFSDPSNEGMLYINYPMVESYLHFSSLPDEAFFVRAVTIVALSQYKKRVREESQIEGFFSMEAAIRKLTDRLPGKESALSDELLSRIFSQELSVFRNMEKTVALLMKWLPQLDFQNQTKHTQLYALAAQIINAAALPLEGTTLSEKYQTLFRQLIRHCLKKTLLLQGSDVSLWDRNVRMAIQKAEPDLMRVLDVQCEEVREHQTIEVLNTAVLLVFDYNREYILDGQ